jgi:enoyl-CoA hydratase/carnithine racemase
MINNPKAMNTFSKGVLAGVMQALEMCSDDPSGEWLPCHVYIITLTTSTPAQDIRVASG